MDNTVKGVEIDPVREKLIELLKDMQTEGNKSSYVEWAGCKMKHEVKNEQIADHLIANGVTVQKWIHVLEKLPENEQWVLCIMKDGRFRVFQWSYIDWQWNDELEWYDEYDVTCWMPLPQPPKEG